MTWDGYQLSGIKSLDPIHTCAYQLGSVLSIYHKYSRDIWFKLWSICLHVLLLWLTRLP